MGQQSIRAVITPSGLKHDYRAVFWRGKWAVEYYEDGKRKRKSLRTTDRSEVAPLVAEFAADRERKSQANPHSVQAVWDGYRTSLGERPAAKTMTYEWVALNPFFGDLMADAVPESTVKSYIKHRRLNDISDWTIWTELGRLRSALRWAEKKGLIGKAPEIPRPSTPPPRDLRMTKEQARQFIEACERDHIKLFVRLALATAARMSAILGLTWDRVDFENRQIQLHDPARKVTSKGRALVAMNDSIYQALLKAREFATCNYVIEHGSKRVDSVKKGLSTAAKKAGLPWVTAHVFRHSAATWMAQGGIPMQEIAQVLGHTDPRITFRIYARFTPEYLRGAAKALEF